ncbi:helix-turn-helix transcriptional regulator [Streptomyces fulvorobeus]|uniref:DNA-binding CsgD family transcriptional regulator/tetratricopeptide (TPR) repeat protein n=1 Tax=Streptomyces fulvorobeus TaxID=284028 RepID=A0A7Y9H9E8_9ACTN|nr:LuxR family transcriptional regulator [Streptomyces fulvorobeus]NYE40252.1 DNA-binding CsgD family transcriptional regulator/tetratricopeptide (TPR) repeat protein [Streptomyces fulvorobeus]
MTSSTTVHSPLRLYGRSGELAILQGLLARLRAGDGGALVLASPPGLGRTALLRRTAAHHADDQGPVLYATGAPAEQRLPYSGLHALLCSAPGVPPAEADRVLRSGVTPGGLLGLLRGLGARRPLLVCVDDAHAWDPDSRAALGFAARRLGAGSRVAVVLGAEDESSFAGLPALRLGPLGDDAAAALLDRLTEGTGGVDPVVRGELLREAAGNPRLLAGIAGRLTADQLAGRTALPYPLPGAEGVLDAHAAHLDALAPDTRTLLLLAAAADEHEPDGAGTDAALLMRAGAGAGLTAGFLDDVLLGSAGITGILQRTGSRLHFSHPLLRRAVLHHAPPARRRAAHELLATLLAGPGASPLPSLVQRACAAPGPDAALAGQLAAAAVAPRPHAERSAALARSAALSLDEPLRAARFAAAAEHARLAGDAGRSRALLARTGAHTVAGHPSSYGTARGSGTLTAGGLAAYVRGMLALRDGPVADAREALITAAGLLAAHDPRRALDALLGAAEAAWAMGDAVAYLDAMSRIPGSPQDRALALYRAGMCAMLGGRTEEGHASLRECLDTSEATEDPGALLRAGVSALVLGEVEDACRSGARALAAVRTRGPEALLPQALEHLAYAELRAGRHARARAHALEGLHAARRTGQPNASAHLHAVLALAASVEGPAEACAAHCDAALAGAGPHGLTQAATLATWAVARADLAAGRPGEAAARLAPLVGPGPRRGHFATRLLAIPCYVEAAVLSGRADESPSAVAAAVEEFAAWSGRTTDPQVPAQLARCQALLAPPEEAAARYAEAMAHHDRAGGDFERARTQLLHGQWLRRRRQTRAARSPLRDALVAFERCSARAWAERAAGELRAAGEAVDAPETTGPAPLAGLTPQQQRIARYVAEGATNREVAVRLSVSPRTVDHHLRNVFATLGIRSRTELARVLGRA